MYPSTKPAATYFPSPAPASANYAFLAKPPKYKHKPQPITVRCAPPRALPRPASSRRRASISSPVFQTNFLVLVDTPTPTSDTPKTPKTPHLTTHGYTAAFSALYQRRGSLPDTPRFAHRTPNSPKRDSTTRSAPSSPKHSTGQGSPKRRHHRRVVSPASPFAPPSPTRVQARPRAKSTTRTPAPAPALAPPSRTPKLSKIRSFTNLRSRTPSPAPPPRPTPPMSSSTMTTPKQTPKRAKRSATPARGSDAYAKYRPMPFIQQMQMIQVLEGGSLKSHIRRHHVHAGQGTAHTGFAIDQEAHGYAFTDERGMIWFDEEEEWEFACLLPQTRPLGRRGIMRLLGKRREEQGEDEWEDFAVGEEQDEEFDAEVLLARGDDELRAGEDDLVAFGGALESAWGRERPARSVLNLPQVKQEHKSRQCRGADSSTVTAVVSAPASELKQEFLATAFAPSPVYASPAQSSTSPPRAASPFRMFTGKPNHRHARSTTDATEGHSFASIGASMRGGTVLDAKLDVPPSPSPSVQWSQTAPVSHDSSTVTTEARLRSVSPPPAAARRLGIDPTTTVSLQPPAPAEAPAKKPSFMNMRRHRN